jgi:hypothetical protein
VADRLVLGRGPEIVVVEDAHWWSTLLAHVPAMRSRFDALPPLQRTLRRAAVLRVVATGRPAPPDALARDIGAPLREVAAALADLERRLFFLVRDAGGEVSWAFPVTADVTPHHLSFSSGERLHGA